MKSKLLSDKLSLRQPFNCQFRTFGANNKRMVKKVFLLLVLNLIMIGDSFSQGVIVGPNPSCGTRNIQYCYSGPCTCGTWQEGSPVTGNVMFGTPVGNCIDVSFTASGTYNIEYVIGSGCGCTAGNVISTTVTTSGAPNPIFTTFDFCENSKNKVAYYDSGLFVFDPDPLDGSTIDPITGVITGGVAGSSYTIKHLVGQLPCADSLNLTINCIASSDPLCSSSGCNVVSNGGFDVYNQCPTSLGQVPRANDWYNGAFGSSDYYNTVCGYTVNSSGSLVLPQPPPSLGGAVGFYVNHTSGYYKEDIGQKVELCQGQKYSFEIAYAANASGQLNTILNDAAIYVGNASLFPVNYDPTTRCPVGFQQIITIPTTGATPTWNTYTTTFTATQNTNALILGASCAGSYSTSGYMFFDDIAIRPIDTVTLSASTITVCPNEPFMANFLIPGGCYGPYDVIYTKNGVLDTAFGVYNNDPLIDTVSVNTVYLLQEIINAYGCSSPLNAPLTVTIGNQSTTSMLAYDFCAGDSNQIVINGNQTGTFSFTSLPSGGETINSNTGLISGAIANTTYFIKYELTGACPDTLYDTITALPCDDTCELVFNGDFEMGNVGFTSPSQQFTSTNCFNDGFYSVAQSLDTCFNGTWVLGKDHTTGNGKFLAVNLNDNTSAFPNAYAYCVSINTQPGEQYSYCMWVANIFDTVTAYAPNPPTVQFELDGSPLGTSFVVPAGGDWYQHGGLFTATTTNSNFCIKQPLPHNGLPGMDVAFDDISVKKVADSVLIGLDKDTVYCNGDSVTLDIKVFGCPIEYAYEVKMPGLDTVFYVLDSMKYTFFVDSSISVEVNSANCQFQWDTILNIWAISDTADFTFDDFCVGDTQIIQMLGTPGGTFSFNPNPMDGATVNPLTGIISNEVGGALYGIKYITPSGCDSITVQVAVNNIDTAILSGGGDICDGVAETITVNFTGTPPWSFTYTDGISIYTVNNVLTSPYTFNVNDTGIYEIVAFSNVNCDGYYSGQAIITGDSLDFEADVYAGCSPLAVNFNHLVNLPSGGNCTWNFGNGQSFNNCTGVNSVYNSPGCFDVTLTVSSANCSATKTIADMICIHDNPEADFSVSPQPLTVYQNVAQLSNQSNGATSYQWFINGVVISNSVNVSYPFPSDTGAHEICLVAINDFGCVDTTCKTVNVYEEISIFVPNSFTPDGDGRNDVFQPVTIGLETYELFIFDRWGELIYTTQKPENNWDGKHEGEPVKTDVYVWKIVYTAPNVSGKKTLHGHVSVLR